MPATSDGSLAERYWLTYVDFLTPDSLAMATAGSDLRETLKSRQAQFDDGFVAMCLEYERFRCDLQKMRSATGA